MRDPRPRYSAPPSHGRDKGWTCGKHDLEASKYLCSARTLQPPPPPNRTGWRLSCDYIPLLLSGFRSGDPHCERRTAGLKQKQIHIWLPCFCPGSVRTSRRFLGWWEGDLLLPNHYKHALKAPHLNIYFYGWCQQKCFFSILLKLRCRYTIHTYIHTTTKIILIELYKCTYLPSSWSFVQCTKRKKKLS